MPTQALAMLQKQQRLVHRGDQALRYRRVGIPVAATDASPSGWRTGPLA